MSVTADVSDKAGNPATQASNPISVDIAAPTIAITGPLAGDDVINATEKGQPLTISGTTTGVENGQQVTVTVGVKTYTATVTDNAWSVTVPAEAVGELPTTGSVSVTADVSDKAGNPATQASNPISVDIAAPTIAITGPLAGDDVINATEKGQPLTISGTTTGVENGQQVTVTVGVKTYTATVTDNAWSVTVPAEAVGELPTTGSVSVTADVSDKAGNPATQASNPISVDIAAPTIAITGPLAGDDVINATEKGQPLTISGTTTGVENGQQVTVTVGVKTYTATVTDNAWSVTVPAEAVGELPTTVLCL
ncbi:Ig-like domain-containing protein [Acinetobacter portensis]|uniref:Ig-like domain-containing protein n=1 Tax=Acinetobacter portensis TaxID=1839785 RepID=UPI0013D0E153|nr:Ig-like domain-containing protein [Acinetobacter portensis]